MRKFLMASVVVGLMTATSPVKADSHACAAFYVEATKAYFTVLHLNVGTYEIMLKAFERLEKSMKSGKEKARTRKIISGLVKYSKSSLKTTKQRLKSLQEMLALCPIVSS